MDVIAAYITVSAAKLSRNYYCGRFKLEAGRWAGVDACAIVDCRLKLRSRHIHFLRTMQVSPAEIQRGLLLLGFESASDPVALSRLLVDIDEDKTGQWLGAVKCAFRPVAVAAADDRLARVAQAVG